MISMAIIKRIVGAGDAKLRILSLHLEFCQDPKDFKHDIPHRRCNLHASASPRYF